MSDVDEPRLLLELTRDITSSLDLQEVLDRSLAGLRRIVDFDGGSIQLVRDGALQMVAAEPAATPEAYSYRLPLGQGFGGRVAVTGEPVYSPDATVDPRADAEGRAKASTAGVRSYFAAPLIVHGEPIGIVQIDCLRVDSFLQRAAAASPHPRSLVRVEVEEGLPPCLTDPSRLGQVLARLLDNAVKFSSATSLVQVSAHRAGDRVEIAVEDEGKGIPEE